MNDMITIDGKLLCRPVDIPKPKKRDVLDVVLGWLEKEDGPMAKLAARTIIGLAGLYLLGQVVMCLVR